MKTSLFIKLACFFLCLPTAYTSDLPVIVEVLKETPLFSQPSLKSQRIATAEAGTSLLFVEKSRRGIWLRLKDSEGTYGWMPADRTDYKEITAAHEQIKILEKNSQAPTEKKQKTKEEMMEEIIREREARAFSPTFRLAPFYKWVNEAEPITSRVGLKLDYNLGKSALAQGAQLNPAWVVLESSFPSPFVSHAKDDMSFALRYSWKAPLWGPLIYVPDLGYAIDKLESVLRHHLSLGLAMGVELGPVDLRVRGGYDFFGGSRASIDAQLGVSF